MQVGAELQRGTGLRANEMEVSAQLRLSSPLQGGIRALCVTQLPQEEQALSTNEAVLCFVTVSASETDAAAATAFVYCSPRATLSWLLLLVVAGLWYAHWSCHKLGSSMVKNVCGLHLPPHSPAEEMGSLGSSTCFLFTSCWSLLTWST